MEKPQLMLMKENLNEMQNKCSTKYSGYLLQAGNGGTKLTNTTGVCQIHLTGITAAWASACRKVQASCLNFLIKCDYH